MDDHFMPPISVEMFAAYLDGNLTDAEMETVENILADNPALSELVDLADSLDQEIQDYMDDDFLYDADMSMLDDVEIEIPQLDDVDDVESDDMEGVPDEIEIGSDIADGLIDTDDDANMGAGTYDEWTPGQEEEPGLMHDDHDFSDAADLFSPDE